MLLPTLSKMFQNCVPSSWEPGGLFMGTHFLEDRHGSKNAKVNQAIKQIGAYKGVRFQNPTHPPNKLEAEWIELIGKKK